MSEVKLPQFPMGVQVSGEDMIPAAQNGTSGLIKVKDVRNIAATVAEGGVEKTASNENLKTVNEKVDILSQSVDTSFQTVNQNFTNVENEIQNANNAITAANQNVTNHEGDTGLHVTPEKQSKWDGYATQLSENTQNIATNTQNISKNTQDILLRPIMTTANITYYVATTGSDTTDDGTSGKPFKTIQYAINKLPQIINHNVNINVASGTYAETVNVNGFNGKGSLYINGTSTDTIIAGLVFKLCTLDIKASNFQLTSTTTNNIICNMDKRITILNCSLINDGRANAVVGLETSFAEVYISNCVISNKGQAIYSGYGSIVVSVANSGSNNAVGLLGDYGGTICKSGTQPVGTTSEVTANGGAIR